MAVDMQEQQYVPPGSCGPAVHLPGSTSAACHQFVTEVSNAFKTTILTPTVTDDYFHITGPPLLQFTQQLSEPWTFVENRNDHRQPGLPAQSAPPQLLPWPAVQP